MDKAILFEKGGRVDKSRHFPFTIQPSKTLLPSLCASASASVSVRYRWQPKMSVQQIISSIAMLDFRRFTIDGRAFLGVAWVGYPVVG